MVSFDVTSLYTNVPIEDTINIIKDLITNDANFSLKTTISPSNFLHLVKLVLTKTWYLFDNNFMSQTDGVAMGGPASSIVAEIVMIAHETTAITTADDQSKIWKRYVDDVFAIIKKTSLDTFHKHINSLHQQIQFTIEHEPDDKLAFLDTLVKKHENGKLSVLVYRKSTHTVQYLNYKSHHQNSCKDSVIS